MALIPASFDFFGEFWLPKNLTVAKLRTKLSRAAHVAQIRNLYVGAICLDDHHRVGQEPLISGAHLSSTGPAQSPGDSGSSAWRVAHLTTGQVLPLSTQLPGLVTRISKGNVRVKLRPGWKSADKTRLRFWQPGQIIRVRRVATIQDLAPQVISYQFRGPITHRPSILSRLKQVPAARWIPAGMSMAMAIGLSLMLNRPWIMLMGLSFPLVILATALGARSGMAGPHSESGSQDHPTLLEPTYTLAAHVDRFSGPHPCDLAEQKSSPLVTQPSVLPIIAVIAPRQVGVPLARALIIGRASTRAACEPVPEPALGGGLNEPWMRWLLGGNYWAHSVLIIKPGSQVPSWCSVTATVSGDLVTWHSGQAIVAQTGFCGLTATRAENLARIIARNSSASAGPDQLPDCVALPEPQQGSQNQASFKAPAVPDPDIGLPIELGIGAHGLPITFDLVADGPHALVAGTTGAGKSELLQTIVLGLTARYSPDQVAIALVDYKGGAGFSHCSRLPHVVGMVTDLDPSSARRAIVGLRQQLKIRELLFERHSVTSFSQFHQATGGLRVLPRIVIVVDELRALLDQEPSFIPDLMTLAAQGRSLGIHLVLATQRPSGVVTAQMRANLNTRLCLRVATPQDSVEVLESAVATHLPHQWAGRAYLKVGGSDPVVLQTYYAGTLPQTPEVFRALQDPISREFVPPVPTQLPDPLLGRVARITDLWHATAPPVPLWVPDLPRGFVFQPDQQSLARLFLAPDQNLAIPLGIGETEGSQTQVLVRVNLDPRAPDGGNLGIIGPSRSGHSTTLSTLFRGCLIAPGQNVAVHGIFATDILATLTAETTAPAATASAMPGPATTASAATAGVDGSDWGRSPRVGTVAVHHEVRRITALFQMLQSRGYRGPSVLFLDDLPRLRASLESHHQGRGWDLLLDLFRSSARLNLTIVFTSSAGTPTILVPFVSQTVVFTSGKSPDDQFLGIPRMWAGSGRAPGRGVLLSSGLPHLVQVAGGYHLDFRAALQPSPTDASGPSVLPPQVSQLPSSFTAPDNVLGKVISSAVGADHHGQVEQVLVPMTGSWIIAGTPGSGRSTTGQRFARAHAYAGTLLGAFGARPTGLFRPFEDLDEFLSSVTGPPAAGTRPGQGVSKRQGPYTVVLDDVDELHARNPQALAQVIDTILQNGHYLAVTTLTSSLSQPRALPPKLTQLSQGITLMPSARTDFHFLGHAIEQHTDPAHLMPGGRIAGRGVIISENRAKPVQIARLL